MSKVSKQWLVTLILLVSPTVSVAGSPVELALGSSTDRPQQPQLAIDAQGTVHVVYGRGNTIHYRSSSNDGRTFAEAVKLPMVNVMSLGMRRGPRIAVADGVICVSAIGGQQGKGRDGDVLAMRSTDGGKTWSKPASVNDVSGSAREGLHAMAASADGTVCCVWLDLRNKKTEVMGSVSADGGKSWGENVLVYKSPDGSVCECCHPNVVFDGKGNLIVQWRNSLGGARDIYTASSMDGGKTFGEAKKLGRGSWPLDACPMDGGAIAVDERGKITSVWRREKSVYLSLDGQVEERLLAVGEQPWIAASEIGPFIVWLSKRGENAYLLDPKSTSPLELARHAKDPVICSGPNGQGPIVAAWESIDGPEYSIHCQVVHD